MKNLAYIHKVNGQIQDREKLLKWFNNYLDKCPNGDQLIEFVGAPRTTAQNAYYWVVCDLIARHLGSTSLEMHEYFKDELLPKTEYFVVIKKIKSDSTTTLDKDQFGLFLDRVIQRAAELGVEVPDLEEYKHMH